MQAFNAEHRRPYFLLRDAGYPFSPYILTPIVDAAEGTPEYRYTRRHTHTRCAIERVFGMLKGRFRCLHKDRVLLYEPEKVVNFFKSYAILHNIMIDNGLQLDDEDFYESEDDDEEQPGDDEVHGPAARRARNQDLQRGRQLRQQIMNDFFM
ncbi:putative nuclease HARBI1 [Diachasma alloeum]|uniref:putative nuclease HARBI1 n=1 Tax=Diachasma alloeum TaxID=454923 RepID=UPI000738456C|nr:putative nuclease HARBI1 [Diachasma alloeum]